MGRLVHGISQVCRSRHSHATPASAPVATPHPATKTASKAPQTDLQGGAVQQGGGRLPSQGCHAGGGGAGVAPGDALGVQGRGLCGSDLQRQSRGCKYVVGEKRGRQVSQAMAGAGGRVGPLGLLRCSSRSLRSHQPLVCAQVSPAANNQGCSPGARVSCAAKRPAARPGSTNLGGATERWAVRACGGGRAAAPAAVDGRPGAVPPSAPSRCSEPPNRGSERVWVPAGCAAGGRPANLPRGRVQSPRCGALYLLARRQ